MKIKLTSIIVNDQAFFVEALNKEHQPPAARRDFQAAPQPMGPAMAAIFQDTCGNLIQIVQR